MRGNALVVLLALGMTLTLTGCSGKPERNEVAHRFALEMADGGDPSNFQDVANGLADDALKGDCSSDSFSDGLGAPALRYAWAVGCTMYFKAEMSQAQIDRANQIVTDYTVSKIGK